MHKKAQSEVGVIIFVLVFQIFLITMLGFLNINPETRDIGTFEGVKIIEFGTNIVFNIAELGWFNLILFTPLWVTIVYIIIRLVRGGG